MSTVKLERYTKRWIADIDKRLLELPAILEITGKHPGAYDGIVQEAIYLRSTLRNLLSAISKRKIVRQSRKRKEIFSGEIPNCDCED